MLFSLAFTPSDENGTDMKAVCKTLLPDYPVIFTHDNHPNGAFKMKK